MPHNKVQLNDDGVIEIFVVGDQDVASVTAMAAKAQEIGAALRADGRPVLILDNLVSIGTVHPEARKVVVRMASTTDYDRLAMLGSGTLMKLGANLLLQATNRGGTVHYFDDRASALEWLHASQ